MEKAIVSGEVVDKNLVVIPIDNKGYFFDFCVYSTMKVLQGKLFFPDFHAERIIESANLLGIKHNLNVSDVSKWLAKLVKVNKYENSLIRMVLVGDPDDVEYGSLYIFAVGSLTFYPNKFYTGGVKVITYPGERLVPKAKSKDLLLSALAYREAKKHGALDALLVDNNGNIREGTRTNFFAIRGNQLITPPAEQVLGGIVQKLVIKLSKPDFEIVREDIPLLKIEEYDEFFMTNTSMNVMPINQIDDHKFVSNFPKTKQIQKLLKHYYKTNNLMHSYLPTTNDIPHPIIPLSN